MECPKIDISELRTLAGSNCPAWQSHELPTLIQDALSSNGFRSLISPTTIEFDTVKYPFRENLISALLRRNDTTTSESSSERSKQRADKKNRDQAIVTAFQDRLAALPLEKLHLAVDPKSSPDEDLHIPRYFYFPPSLFCASFLLILSSGRILVEWLLVAFVVATSASYAK